MASKSPSASAGAGWGFAVGAAALVAGLTALWLYFAIGSATLDGFTLDLGSVGFPRPRHLYFLAYWSFFGGVAAAGIGFGLARLVASTPLPDRFSRAWCDSSDAAWIVAGSLLGFLVPAACRAWVLHGTALTDDESAYRFMAQLIAGGRLTVESHDLKLFFDRPFMINDGSMYAKYFVGWPALMAPGAWLGVTGFMNAVYSALTVAPLFLVLRRLAGGTWARAGIVLYLSAPMLMIAAATELSHTSCMAALAWTTWFVLRSRDAGAPPWTHAGLATAFASAFFVRPFAALGIGLPLLAWWALGLGVRSGTDRWRALAAFGLPALAFAGAFLAVNTAQTGSAWTTAYERELTYAKENGFRFTSVEPQETAGPPELRLDQPLVQHAAKTGAALFRLNFALFGWPCSLLFVAFARGRGVGVLWASALAFTALHFAVDNPGFDTFGPVHWFELAWPVLLLTAIGLKGLAGMLDVWSSAVARPELRAFLGSLPACLLIALIAVTLPGYTRPRLAAIARVVEDIREPAEAVRRAGLGEALIFTIHPLSNYCRSEPTRHFKLWRDNNDPDLANPVLWVNHLSVEEDRRLLARFPGRVGRVLVWDRECNVRLLPLEQLTPGSIPDVDGTRRP